MLEGFFNSVKILVVFILVASLGYYVFNDAWGDLYKDNITSQEITQKQVISLGINKQPSISFVSETEYNIIDGNGSTIIKLDDYKGDKINTSCWESILYPNKSIYMNWAVMSYQPEYGNYYMNFPLHPTIGIYDQEVRCLVNNKNVSLGKGFHMNNLSNVIDTKINELKQDNMVSLDG